MSPIEVGTGHRREGAFRAPSAESMETSVSTGTIVLIIVIVLVALALVGLAAWMSAKKKREQHHAQAENIRHEAVADAGGVQESEVRAREAEARAEQARLQAQRAEEEAARAHQGVSQEQALHEERMREADRLDPKVDHRSDDYTPDTSAAETQRAGVRRDRPGRSRDHRHDGDRRHDGNTGEEPPAPARPAREPPARPARGNHPRRRPGSTGRRARPSDRGPERARRDPPRAVM